MSKAQLKQTDETSAPARRTRPRGLSVLHQEQIEDSRQRILKAAEVAFAKNWQRNMNSSTRSLSRRISDDDAVKIADQVRTGFGDIFAKAYQQAGYQVATAPGPHVLRVRTAVANLYIAAPDMNVAGRTRVYTVEAGRASLIVEARDSETDALLGRAVESGIAGDNSGLWRTSVSNRADFSRLFTTWAKAGADGLTELKALSPISGT